MLRNLKNFFPAVFYMLCGATLCLIYMEIMEGFGFSSTKDVWKGASKCNCQCSEALLRVVELQKRALKMEIELLEERNNFERLKKEVYIDSTRKVEHSEHHSESVSKIQQNTVHNTFYVNNSGSGIDNTKLPVWAFNKKYLFRSDGFNDNPKFKTDRDKDTGVKRMIDLAFQKSCNHAKKRKQIKKCELIHGSLIIDIEKGIKTSFILSQTKNTSLRIMGIFQLQQIFSIQKIHAIKNQQSEIHLITMMSDALTLPRLKDFLSMIKEVKTNKQTIFVYFSLYGTLKSIKLFEKVILDASKKVENIKFITAHVKGRFERGSARHHGVSMLPKRNVLVLFLDIDITFNDGFLQRCQQYTEPRESVYFPIVFSQYSPKFLAKPNKPFLISSNQGIWRSSGHGNLCVFKSDYLAAGGFNVNITGWGSEDDELYQRFLDNKSLTVFRFPDQGIIHRWHEKVCDLKSLGKIRYNRCLATRYRFRASCKDFTLHYFKQRINKVPFLQNASQK